MIEIYFSVDVETSIGGTFNDPEKLRPVPTEKSIFGRIGRREYGVGLIMDTLDRYGIKGTFFLETLCSHYFGKSVLENVSRYILQRGHDIQLHLHPNYQIFKFEDWKNRCKKKMLFSDILANYSLHDQIMLIHEAQEILKDCGVSPIAFRAGCFGADRNTLAALRENKLLIDTSYNASFLNRTCFINLNGLLNNPLWIDGIYEMPITNYRVLRLKKFRIIRHLDICAAGFNEIETVLRNAEKYNLSKIVILLHSFSFILKNDQQFHDIHPNRILIQRFKKLCKYIGENKHQFKVQTFSQIKTNTQNIKNDSLIKQQKFPPSDYLATGLRIFSNAVQSIISAAPKAFTQI